jgi:hypothetical protein
MYSYPSFTVLFHVEKCRHGHARHTGTECSSNVFISINYCAASRRNMQTRTCETYRYRVLFKCFHIHQLLCCVTSKHADMDMRYTQIQSALQMYSHPSITLLCHVETCRHGYARHTDKECSSNVFIFINYCAVSRRNMQTWTCDTHRYRVLFKCIHIHQLLCYVTSKHANMDKRDTQIKSALQMYSYSSITVLFHVETCRHRHARHTNTECSSTVSYPSITVLCHVEKCRHRYARHTDTECSSNVFIFINYCAVSRRNMQT